MPESIISMTGGVIRQQKNTILKNVNIDIKSGEFVYLIGKVGSGKSSFLKTLYAELPLEYGNAEVAGFQLKKIRKSQIPLLRRKCGIVFQDFKLLTDRNVYANLEFVLRATGWNNRKAIQERIETVLAKVGMSDKQAQMPHQLSGGEQQRIVLARALLNAPPLILADEPTGNIDPETSYQLVELLKEICDTGKTIIIATHQYDLIEKYPGRIFCCENGELYEKISSSTCCIAAETPEPTVQETSVMEAKETDISEGIKSEMIVSEEIAVQIETIQAIAETSKVATASPASEIQQEAEEDILSLIGKLEYPEVTAFDYELEQLPELKEQEENAENNPNSAMEKTLEADEEKTSFLSDNEKPTVPEEKKEKMPFSPPIDLELID